ncbi:hypothetical protein BH20ACT6_BH20ACT6_05380 [soil metagenome]
MPAPPLVTFDVFSALVDSRHGAAQTLDGWAGERGWAVSGRAVYDRWDALNKSAHREVQSWLPYTELAETALAATYAQLDLQGEPATDTRALLASMADWPLWPDVEEGLAELSGHCRLGVLSNIDEDLLALTRVRTLPVDPTAVVASERVRAYKPAARMYAEAGRLLGRFVHVASSARDVRGALEAGVAVVRLRRPGHSVDPAGPLPQHETSSTIGLAALITEVVHQR